MEALGVLASLRAAGFALTADGDRLLVRPGGRLTGEQVAAHLEPHGLRPEHVDAVRHLFDLGGERGRRCEAGGSRTSLRSRERAAEGDQVRIALPQLVEHRGLHRGLRRLLREKRGGPEHAEGERRGADGKSRHSAAADAWTEE